MCGHVWLPEVLVPLYLLMEKQQNEFLRAIISSQTGPNASELIGKRFILQMDIDPVHTVKAVKLSVLELLVLE